MIYEIGERPKKSANRTPISLNDGPDTLLFWSDEPLAAPCVLWLRRGWYGSTSKGTTVPKYTEQYLKGVGLRRTWRELARESQHETQPRPATFWTHGAQFRFAHFPNGESDVVEALELWLDKGTLIATVCERYALHPKAKTLYRAAKAFGREYPQND